MHVAVDTVAPSVAPAVGLEEILHHGRRVVPVAKIDGATVDDERPSQVIGYEPSSLKPDRVRLSGTSEFRSFLPAWTAQAGRALHVFLDVLKNGHGRSSPMSKADSRSTSAAAAL